MKPILFIVLIACSAPVVAQQSGTVIVANMSDNTVSMVDVASGETRATLPSGPAPHEVSVSSSGEWAVVTNYGDRNNVGSSLTLIDVQSAEIASVIDLGVYQRPHGVFFLPDNVHVAVTSEAMQTLLFINVESGDIVDTVSTTQRASHMLASTPDGRTMFTTNIVDGTVTEFDGITRTRGRVLKAGPFVEGIALSPDGSRAWIGSNADKQVLVMNIASGEIEKTFDDFGFPYRMAVMPNGKYALLCDPGKSEIRVIDAATLEHVKTISIDGSQALESSEFPGSASPEGLVITPDNLYAYVSLQALNTVAAVDLATLELISQYKTGVWPDGISFSPLVTGR